MRNVEDANKSAAQILRDIRKVWKWKNIHTWIEHFLPKKISEKKLRRKQLFLNGVEKKLILIILIIKEKIQKLTVLPTVLRNFLLILRSPEKHKNLW